MSRALLILLLGVACGAASAQEADGKRIYDRACGYCHRAGLWGANSLARRVGPERALLENRTDLTPQLIRSVTRAGLGGMPPYRRSELTDAELEAIAAYLTRKR